MKRWKRPPRHATDYLSAALAIGALAFGVVGCAPKSPSDEVLRELARIRRDQRALSEELAKLRDELVRRDEILEHGTPVDQPAARPSRPSTPPVPVTPATLPRAAITAVLDSYGRALEDEDLQRVREDLYGGDLPEEDSRYLAIWFDNADMLEVEVEPLAIELYDGRAVARVRQTMKFRLNRISERRTVRLELLILLEQSAGGWQLRELRPQR